jgi:Molybdopterin cofactor-binding domain
LDDHRGQSHDTPDRGKAPAVQPHANPLGITYDSGRYEDAMDMALALADWDGFPARRAEAGERGKLRGIGIANYVELTSGAHRERTEITVLPEGRVELVMHDVLRAGHETSFAQLVTEWLGVPFESITYLAHDNARVAAGDGSHSGRSMKLATTIIGKATDDIIDKVARSRTFYWRLAKSTSNSNAAATGSPTPITRSAFSRSPRPLLPARTYRRIYKARSPASPTRRSQSRAFPTTRKSAKSRSMPKRARFELSAMQRWTMLGAPPIR